MSAPNRWTTQASFIASGCVRARADGAAQAGVLDRELLDAGEQHPVDALLAAEILLAVLEQPARQRQQQASLHQQNEPADRPADES